MPTVPARVDRTIQHSGPLRSNDRGVTPATDGVVRRISTPTHKLRASTLRAHEGILLDKWIHELMTLALQHAGAERGVLLVPQGKVLQALAEAVTDSNGIVVRLVSGDAVPDVPASLLRYVQRTRERVLLDDASAPNFVWMDAYFVRNRCRSAIGLPLVKHGEVIGLLYLENNLSPCTFTPQRSALLELVAAHAAVSLDHARLFSDLAAENVERRKAEATLEKRLAFERLISDLSADIGESPVDALDSRISSWLERLSLFVGIERAVFFEYSARKDEFRTAAFCCPPAQRPPPSTIDGARLPATLERMRHNEPFRCETSAEIPVSDRWVFDRVGIRSVIGLPASIEGVGLGCLFLGAVREERQWPDDMVQRLRVIADIFANAVARKHAERDRKIQRELAQALEFRELVMGILGHDLRSPLSAASVLTQLIQRQEGLPEAVLRRAEAIDNSMKRMNDLIVTLLDFSESRFKGTMTIARTRTELELICARVVAEQLAENQGRTIVQHREGTTEGDWDPVRMEQVVSNLLSNALKHGDSTLPVKVELRSEGNDVVVLEVTNLGTPIPPDVLGKIFEPFRRGPTHEPGGRRGLGLGLYIVRQIVLSHGGSVTAKSGADDGTVFTVRLPRHGIETGPVGLTPKDAGSPKFESGGPAPVSHSRSRLRPPTPTVEASLSSKKVS